MAKSCVISTTKWGVNGPTMHAPNDTFLILYKFYLFIYVKSHLTLCLLKRTLIQCWRVVGMSLLKKTFAFFISSFEVFSWLLFLTSQRGGLHRSISWPQSCSRADVQFQINVKRNNSVQFTESSVGGKNEIQKLEYPSTIARDCSFYALRPFWGFGHSSFPVYVIVSHFVFLTQFLHL